MRFNMREELFFGNIVSPILGLIAVLAIYSNILNVRFVWELKWEMLVIFSITILSLVIGIGIGAHIAAVSIEKSMPEDKPTPETSDVLYFFHWPFGHKLTFIPTALMFYLLLLFDLLKGTPDPLKLHQIALLTTCAVTLGVFSTIVFIITHVTRIIFFTFGTLLLSILLVLTLEDITLVDHVIGYFFTILYASVFIMVSIYRYIHRISPKLHRYIQLRIPNGDKVTDIEL